MRGRMVRRCPSPFEHFARIFVDKVVLPGITNQLQQFITVFRFAVEKLVQNEGEKSFSGCRGRYCVNCRRSWRC